MSYFVFGFLEFDFNLEKDERQAYEPTRNLGKIALSHNYSIEFATKFEDAFLRDYLDRTREIYNQAVENTLEFIVSDAPITWSIDTGLYEFFSLHKTHSYEQIPYESELFKFLTEVWAQHFIKKAVFIFSFALDGYQLLDHLKCELNGMLCDLWSYYSLKQKNLDSCYILSKV